MEDLRPEKPEPLPVDPDGVPAGMKNHDHWVCWRYEWRCQDDSHGEWCSRTDCDDGEWSKVPKQPNDDFAKTNDESTWSSFEAVYEAYETGDYDGVGYVFNGHLLGVDWDDVRDPDHPHGSVPDLVTDLIGKVESYTEISPSGTGYHTIVEGTSPDDGSGRNRADLPCDPVEDGWETPHVEIYDADSPRYFTVTGQHLGGTEETVKEREAEVEEVYNEYIDDSGDDETPGEPTPSADAGDIDLSDEELLEKAKGADDDGYFEDLYEGNWRRHTSRWKGGDSHSEARMALISKLAFWCAKDKAQMRRLFKKSGLAREKLDKSMRDFDDYAADEAIAKCDDVYDPSAGRSDDVEEIPTGGDDDYTAQSDLVVYKSGYAYESFNEETEEYSYNRITNFTIEALARLKHENSEDPVDSLHLLVKPAGGEPQYEVVVDEKVFNDTAKFRNKVAPKTSVRFDGGQSDLNEIAMAVNDQQPPTRKACDVIGIKGGEELVTPNGTLTADGWVDDADHVYSRDGQTTASLAWQLDPDHGDEPDADEVARILELVPNTRPGKRFIPALAWFYAAPLRPEPYIADWVGRFNFLNIQGDTGAAKSGTLEVLHPMFGFENSLPDAETTPYSILDLFTSTTLPAVIDEYKPDDMKSGAVKQIKRKLRVATGGGRDTKGNASGDSVDIDGYDLVAPMCVAGEQLVTGSAEERRAIQLQWRDDAVKNPKYRNNYEKLMGEDLEHLGDGADLHQHALAYYQWLLDQDPEDLKEKFTNAAQFVNDYLGDEAETMRVMVKQSFVTIAFGSKLYREFASEYGVTGADHGVTEDAIIEAMDYVKENTVVDPESRVSRMLSVMYDAKEAGYLEEGVHYQYVSPRSSEGEELRIRWSQAKNEVSKYLKDYDRKDEQDVIINGDYTDRLQKEYEDPNGVVVSKQKATRFDNAGTKQARGFDPDVWSDIDAGGATDEGIGGDADGDGGGDGDLATVSDGFESFTATVVSKNESEDWGVEFEGILTDNSGNALKYKVAEPHGGLPSDFEMKCDTTYRFELVEIDGGVAKIDPKATEIKRLVEATGSNSQRSITDGGQTGAETGGETEPKHEDENAVYEVLEDEYDGSPIPAGSLAAAVADRHDIAPDRVKALLDSMENRPDSRVMSAGSNKYEPV